MSRRPDCVWWSEKVRNMGQITLHGQIWRTLDAIDKQGESKHLAKQEQGWKLGQPVYGVFSGGTQDRVY